jgi:hypothetical protein
MRKHTGIAAFSDLRTPSSDGVRDAITVRPSASANFFVDSEDRVNYPLSSSTDFTINKSQSLFNGFFNRLAVAEVVLNWGVPNITEYWGNSFIQIDNATTLASFNITIPDGFYRVIDLLQEIVDRVNTAATTAGDPLRLEVQYTQFGKVSLESVGVGTDPFQIWTGPPPNFNLAIQLFTRANLGPYSDTSFTVSNPVILGTKYIDIVCQQLTYNQDLKDNTTAQYNRDVLYRWYFTYDNVPVAYDQIIAEIDPGQVGPPVYPPTYALANTDIAIIEGYTAFVSRRTPPVPKQVRWSPEQPVGQVNFQVYDDQGRLLNLDQMVDARMDFQMSMLLSED